MNKKQEQANADWIRKATEQLTPRRVGRWKSGHACCPKCERGVIRENNFCGHCGQALDWSFDVGIVVHDD